MKSEYELVNTILTQLEQQASSSKNVNIIDIVRKLAKKYGEFESGSSRAVIVLPELQIVIKVPYTHAGYMQNRIEYDYSNMEMNADVYECHNFADKENYIIVSPYYKPVIDRYDELINEIFIDDKETINDVCAKYTNEYVRKHYSEIDRNLISVLINDIETMPEKTTLDNAIDMIDNDELERFVYDIFDDHYLDWYDHNIDNFGIDEKSQQIIMIDSGLQSYEDLCKNSQLSEEVTYLNLVTYNESNTHELSFKYDSIANELEYLYN